MCFIHFSMYVPGEVQYGNKLERDNAFLKIPSSFLRIRSLYCFTLVLIATGQTIVESLVAIQFITMNLFGKSWFCRCLSKLYKIVFIIRISSGCSWYYFVYFCLNVLWGNAKIFYVHLLQFSKYLLNVFLQAQWFLGKSVSYLLIGSWVILHKYLLKRLKLHQRKVVLQLNRGYLSNGIKFESSYMPFSHYF